MKKLAAAIAYLVYCIAIIEALCAAYSLSGLSPTHHIPPYALAADQSLTSLGQWRSNSEVWGTWHKPDSQTKHMKACFTAIYQANSHGARDKDRTLAASSHPRYVVLGDSFVEGVGVNAEQRLTDLLEAQTGHEFLNFGGVDFGPLQYEILYRNLASRFEHDAVLALILPDNDFIDNDPQIWSHTKRRRPVYNADGTAAQPAQAHSDNADTRKKKSGSNPFWTYFWAYGAVSDVRHILAARDIRAPNSQADYSGYRDATPKQISHVLGSLARIKQAAGDKPLFIVLAPRLNDINVYRQQPNLPVPEIFRRFAQEHGVHVLDLLPIMAADADALSLYLPCDGHWSERGNRVAAEIVYQAWFKLQ